jgi:hypothetical protein
MDAIPTSQLLDRFADAIDTAGIAAVPSGLFSALAAAARSVGASPIALAVLVDPTEPAVTRERAFHKLSIQIVGRSGRLTAPAARVLLPA